jgi:hypothetical protein
LGPRARARNGYYMVHPAQLLNPVVPVAFLVGLPFLFRA